MYRGTSLISNSTPLGPCSMPRALWWPYGGGLFLMSEVPLYHLGATNNAVGTLPERETRDDLMDRILAMDATDNRWTPRQRLTIDGRPFHLRHPTGRGRTLAPPTMLSAHFPSERRVMISSTFAYLSSIGMLLGSRSRAENRSVSRTVICWGVHVLSVADKASIYCQSLKMRPCIVRR